MQMYIIFAGFSPSNFIVWAVFSYNDPCLEPIVGCYKHANNFDLKSCRISSPPTGSRATWLRNFEAGDRK